jgi:peroxiredoxin
MRVRTLAVVAVGALSLCLHGLQAVKVRRLEQQIDANESVNRGIIGLNAAAIAAKDAEGRPVKVGLTDDGRPTILYFFRPSCHWCLENLEAFKLLTANVSQKYNIIGISLDANDLGNYVKQHGMSSIPIYVNPELPEIRKYQLGITPETIVVSTDGTIIQDWRGAYIGGVGQAVGHFFGVRLPPV